MKINFVLYVAPTSIYICIMILRQNKNTTVSVPEFKDMVSAHVAYQAFKNNYTLTMSDFIKFLSQPGTERDSFLTQFSVNAIIRNNSYVRVIYS